MPDLVGCPMDIRFWRAHPALFDDDSPKIAVCEERHRHPADVVIVMPGLAGLDVRQCVRDRLHYDHLPFGPLVLEQLYDTTLTQLLQATGNF